MDTTKQIIARLSDKSIKSAKEDGEFRDEYKVSDMMLTDEYKDLKMLAKFVQDADLGSTTNHAADDILKNRKYTLKELKSDIKILVSGAKTAADALGKSAMKSL